MPTSSAPATVSAATTAWLKAASAVLLVRTAEMLVSREMRIEVVGIGLFTVAVGFLLRHTAGTISIVLALMLILGNMVNLVPGAFGEWLTKLMPGNAGSAISTPVSFNPNLLDPWVGFAVFCAEIAVLLAAAYVVVRRRDA